MILVDAGDRVVPGVQREAVGQGRAQELASLGVTVREGLLATAIDDRRTDGQDGRDGGADRGQDRDLGGRSPRGRR